MSPFGITLDEAKLAANSLKEAITINKAFTNNKGDSLTFEGWQFLGLNFGLTVGCTATREKEDGTIGFVATASAYYNGQICGGAEGECAKDEVSGKHDSKHWEKSNDYEIRSMAQTRACVKAYRNILSYIVTLAGLTPTPAEEMDTKAEKKEAIATAGQVKMIEGLADETNESITLHCGIYGVDTPHQLTKNEASEVIDRLKEVKRNIGKR